MKKWTEQGNVYYDPEIISIKEDTQNNTKIVTIDNYLFEVDENLIIKGPVDVTDLTKTEVTYEVHSLDRRYRKNCCNCKK